MGFVFGFSCRVSQNSCYTLECLSYDINSMCAGKPWSWRIQRCVKLNFPTLWGRHGGFWSRCMAQNLESWPIVRFEIMCPAATSKVSMSAPKCRKVKFYTPMDAPGLRLFRARRISIVWQTLERVATGLWKSEQKSKNKPSTPICTSVRVWLLFQRTPLSINVLSPKVFLWERSNIFLFCRFG